METHDPAAWRPRIQIEAWSEGDLRLLLVVAQGRRRAKAHLLTVDVATHAVRVGDNDVSKTPWHHDGEAVARALVTHEAVSEDIRIWGVFGDGPVGDRGLWRPGGEALPTLCHGVLTGAGTLFGWPTSTCGFMPGSGKSNLMGQMIAKAKAEADRRVFDHPEGTPVGFGYAAPPPEGRKGNAVEACAPSAPPRGTVVYFEADAEAGRSARVGTGLGKLAVTPFLSGFPDRQEPAIDEYATLRQALETLISESVQAFVGAHMDGEALRILRPQTWTARSYAFYAGADEGARRRRQAAALYPALAPVLATRMPVRERVEASRPFETELMEELRLLLPLHGDAGLAQPTVRRLRTLPADAGFEMMRDLVRIAASLPVDWLPTEPTGWHLLHKALNPLMVPARRLGLGLNPLCAHLRDHWLEPVPPLGSANDAAGAEGRRKALFGASDMTVRMVDTLVRPCILSTGGTPSEGRDAAFAGAVLFGGKGLAAVDALQKRWHRGLARFEAGLPVQDGVNAWVAPFEAFTASNGYVVTCLTSEAALKAEGAKGQDADGINGLDHCVGGYGRRCHSGESVIASVRAPSRRGMRRVSTVEFETFGCADGVWEFAIVQHSGKGNEDPPRKAEAAVRELEKALRRGLHPVDVEALKPRDPETYDDVYDWREPGALRQAFEAWRPFLPRGVAGEGPEGFVARLSSLPPPWAEAAPVATIIDRDLVGFAGDLGRGFGLHRRGRQVHLDIETHVLPPLNRLW